ncbi:hypothetical protein O181_064567 [Austropuccinia psidii MF-1]|uniref:Uncharacterized protein n=1 Tax=Austropuccinia psidii MF-1 TaxID=1389203 RepID=A0A9Q3EVZ7_9BASI|nr:hypothetical protein [Austropuccinia psidii MF-1]
MDRIPPPSQYSVESLLAQEINSHIHKWLSYGNYLFKKCGFPKCTFSWNSPPSSPWNTSNTAIILHSLELCYWHGGTRSYQIEEELNNQANKIAIVDRWLLGRKSIWKKKTPPALMEYTTMSSELILNDHPRAEAALLVNGSMSDVDPESLGQPLPSISWRSNQIGELLQLLDEGYKQLANNTRAKRDCNNKIKHLKPDPHIPKAQEFGNTPNVAPEALASSTEVEGRGIKLQEPFNLSLAMDKLRSMTRRKTVTQYSYMKT